METKVVRRARTEVVGRAKTTGETSLIRDRTRRIARAGTATSPRAQVATAKPGTGDAAARRKTVPERSGRVSTRKPTMAADVKTKRAVRDAVGPVRATPRFEPTIQPESTDGPISTEVTAIGEVAEVKGDRRVRRRTLTAAVQVAMTNGKCEGEASMPAATKTFIHSIEWSRGCRRATSR